MQRRKFSRKIFFYSVPHKLIRQQVDLGATARTIKIIHRGKCVAVHQRRYGGRRNGTDPVDIRSSTDDMRVEAGWISSRGRLSWPETEGFGSAGPLRHQGSAIPKYRVWATSRMRLTKLE